VQINRIDKSIGLVQIIDTNQSEMILRSLVIEATPYQPKGEQCVAVCCSVSQCDCIALCCIYVTFVYARCQVLGLFCMILRSLVIEATPYQPKGEQCVAVCCSVSQCDCIALCCIYVTFVYARCQVLGLFCMILRSLVIEATPYQPKGEQCVAVCCSVSQCDCIALCCIYVTFVYARCQVLGLFCKRVRTHNEPFRKMCAAMFSWMHLQVYPSTHDL